MSAIRLSPTAACIQKGFVQPPIRLHLRCHTSEPILRIDEIVRQSGGIVVFRAESPPVPVEI